MALTAPPADATFTRGELVERARITDNVAAFWIRRGLIVAERGGEGKGSHRRFGRMQVMIAALLGELQRFGLNIQALERLADLLQNSVRLGERYKVNSSALWRAASLAEDLENLRRGVVRQIYPYGDEDAANRPARDAQELARHWCNKWNDDDEAKSLLEMAGSMQVADLPAIHLFVPILAEMDEIGPGRDSAILFWQDKEEWRYDLSDDPDVRFRTADEAGVSSAIYLALDLIIRRTWSIDQTERAKVREMGRQLTLASLRANRGK